MGIGEMKMPAGFRYKNVYLKGKPQHDRFDSFRIAHPQMDTGKRAKIFAPFDALKGFDEAVASRMPIMMAGEILKESSPSWIISKSWVSRRSGFLRFISHRIMTMAMISVTTVPSMQNSALWMTLTVWSGSAMHAV